MSKYNTAKDNLENKRSYISSHVGCLTKDFHGLSCSISFYWTSRDPTKLPEQFNEAINGCFSRCKHIPGLWCLAVVVVTSGCLESCPVIHYSWTLLAEAWGELDIWKSRKYWNLMVLNKVKWLADRLGFNNFFFFEVFIYTTVVRFMGGVTLTLQSNP